ncbi:MAG: phosphoenolpyruvate--protein phosphotransferase [candidate division WOR-3 bacterium]|nr:phosphoenolpyruvate--protein phosphotransferase [candidate division WOR-3 bacterium]MCX7837545.1 phosphoenolpyruvate--protein phosphotransferase [candidate division WOR-3 bacterium]MDW8113641.1 phosphoenolpyruvate--protein phosphotransferase [candidate division WOR-3 bacterium]
MKERILRGIPVSGDFGYGDIKIYSPELPIIEKKEILPHEIPQELEKFERAIILSKEDFEKIYQKVRAEIGKDIAEFIQIQIAFLTDETVLKETKEYIEKERVIAEYAYSEVIKRYYHNLINKGKTVFIDKGLEIFDVCCYVIEKLKDSKKGFSLLQPKEKCVIFAQSLTPMNMALLDKNYILGIALEMGGKTSHISIMAKAKEIPTVVGVEKLLHFGANVQKAIIDGNRGMVILSPTEKRISLYEKEKEELTKRRKLIIAKKEREAKTKDGKYIDISANIEFVYEAVIAKEYGAKGIGLFRTEYLFLSKRNLPTEEEQFQLYKEVAEKMKPYFVIIRTFDLGGDKIIPGYFESNPFLGWRGIRFCLSNLDFFKTQLKAILKASTTRNIKIMLPMVSNIEEVIKTKKILEELKEELRREKIDFDENIELGIMVETPSSVLLSDVLAKLCHFFSIGSNDLTQYTLACDRGNEKVSYLFNHYHPAVLRLIKETIKNGHKNGIWVGLCGELAGEPLGIILLIGLGIDELSMAPHLIPYAKELISLLDTDFCKELAEKVINFSTVPEVIKYLKKKIKKEGILLEKYTYV